MKHWECVLLLRQYIILRLWLKGQCDKLTIRQRKLVICVLSAIYLICSLSMIMKFFIHQEEDSLPIPMVKFVDSPIHQENVKHRIINQT